MLALTYPAEKKQCVPSSTAANLYCNLLSTIGVVCLELGLPGLIIILDEAEEVGNVWYNYQFYRGLNMLAGLSLVTSNNRKLLAESREWKIATGEAQETLRGKETDLVYSGLLCRLGTGVPL